MVAFPPSCQNVLILISDGRNWVHALKSVLFADNKHVSGFAKCVAHMFEAKTLDLCSCTPGVHRSHKCCITCEHQHLRQYHSGNGLGS